MARIKRAVNAHKKRRKVLKLAKGFWGAKSKQYRAANEQVMRSLRYAYIGRKLRKRDFRSLWITRINAAARINGMSYSTFVSGLKRAGVNVNRKMLAELAINDANGFAQLVDVARTRKVACYGRAEGAALSVCDGQRHTAGAQSPSPLSGPRRTAVRLGARRTFDLAARRAGLRPILFFSCRM